MAMQWIEEKGALQKTISFSDFKEALAFVHKVGEIAERLQHHPDICIKEYRTVHISTTTHDKANSVTAKDRELASAIDAQIVY
jgi:4a-hydroxytetrahydrobiopterin dehydratase